MIELTFVVVEIAYRQGFEYYSFLNLNLNLASTSSP